MSSLARQQLHGSGGVLVREVLHGGEQLGAFGAFDVVCRLELVSARPLVDRARLGTLGSSWGCCAVLKVRLMRELRGKKLAPLAIRRAYLHELGELGELDGDRRAVAGPFLRANPVPRSSWL